MKCELCGSNVEIKGKTTHYYKNLDKEKIDKLQAENKKLEETINWLTRNGCILPNEDQCLKDLDK